MGGGVEPPGSGAGGGTTLPPGNVGGRGTAPPPGNTAGGPTETFGATGMIGPCGMPTPPYGTTMFFPARPGRAQSQKSVQGCVLHPDTRQIRNIHR